MNDPKAEVTEAARRIRSALTRLGHSYRTKNGDLIEISFQQLGVVGDRYGVLEVDVQRLPPRVSIEHLTRDSTLHHLTAVVGRPVHKLNTTGLTYCVDLQGASRRRLPRRVRLSLEARPPGDYMVPIGHSESRAEWRSLYQTSHILVGGESRSGKSTWLLATLVALLAGNEPSALRLALIDPKGVDFTPLGVMPHLLRPIATSPEQASSLTGLLVEEMGRRRELFAAVFARDLATYNQRARAREMPTLPMILIVVDEVTDIALQCGLKSSFYRDLIRLSSKGAAFGLTLILATQNPKAEVLNTLIRGNLSTRIAFRVTGREHSRTILGCAGAQRLPQTVRGRMLARLDGGLVELQGFYVPDEDVLALAEGWSGRHGVTLTPVERDLVLYAHRELGGAFPIRKLYARFRGTISYRQLVKLGRRWEAQGWLEPQASVVDARRVSARLLEQARCVTGDA